MLAVGMRGPLPCLIEHMCTLILNTFTRGFSDAIHCKNGEKNLLFERKKYKFKIF